MKAESGRARVKEREDSGETLIDSAPFCAPCGSSAADGPSKLERRPRNQKQSNWAAWPIAENGLCRLCLAHERVNFYLIFQLTYYFEFRSPYL